MIAELPTVVAGRWVTSRGCVLTASRWPRRARRCARRVKYSGRGWAVNELGVKGRLSFKARRSFLEGRRRETTLSCYSSNSWERQLS